MQANDYNQIDVLMLERKTLNHISKYSYLPLVEGDQKALFSIATTPRCRGGSYSFPWIAPFYP